VIEDANAPAPAVYVGFRMPNARDARAPAVSMLPSLLASGRSSPLYDALVRRQQVATNVFAFNFGLVDGADILVVAAVGRPGASADSLERRCWPSWTAWAGADRRGRAAARAGHDALRARQPAADDGRLRRPRRHAGAGVDLPPRPGLGEHVGAALGAVTAPQVRELARERMVPDNRVVLVFVPRRPPHRLQPRPSHEPPNPDRPGALALLAAACASPAPRAAGPAPQPGAALVTEAPELPPLRPYQLPPIEEFRLDNGLRVMLLQQRTMPLVTARAIVDAGASFEPAEKNGLAVLTGSLLAEGTRELTGPQLAERMEQLGAQFQTGASQILAFATVTALKSTFPEAIRLAASALIEPSFPEGEFSRVRQPGDRRLACRARRRWRGWRRRRSRAPSSSRRAVQPPARRHRRLAGADHARRRGGLAPPHVRAGQHHAAAGGRPFARRGAAHRAGRVRRLAARRARSCRRSPTRRGR
jgi:zinc protease